jgi:PIN domain nuclease of toxin-antitoxin system
LTYLDTHCAVWLRTGDGAAFSKRAKQLIEADDELLISPAVMLEIEMLFERKRVRGSAREIVGDLAIFSGVRVCSYPFPLVIEAAVLEKWTRDPGDRIITAHARARNAALITHDREILRNYDLAVW